MESTDITSSSQLMGEIKSKLSYKEKDRRIIEKKQGKSAAERMREYRARKRARKILKQQSKQNSDSLDKTLEHSVQFDSLEITGTSAEQTKIESAEVENGLLQTRIRAYQKRREKNIIIGPHQQLQKQKRAEYLKKYRQLQKEKKAKERQENERLANKKEELIRKRKAEYQRMFRQVQKEKANINSQEELIKKKKRAQYQRAYRRFQKEKRAIKEIANEKEEKTSNTNAQCQKEFQQRQVDEQSSDLFESIKEKDGLHNGIVMEALEIKQEPLPYSSLNIEIVTALEQDPLLLNSERTCPITVLKREDETIEGNTKFVSKGIRTTKTTNDESIAVATYSNKTVKIEIKEEPIESDYDYSSATSQGATKSSSIVVPVSFVPQVKLEPNEIEVPVINYFYKHSFT